MGTPTLVPEVSNKKFFDEKTGSVRPIRIKYVSVGVDHAAGLFLFGSPDVRTKFIHSLSFVPCLPKPSWTLEILRETLF